MFPVPASRFYHIRIELSILIHYHRRCPEVHVITAHNMTSSPARHLHTPLLPKSKMKPPDIPGGQASGFSEPPPKMGYRRSEVQRRHLFAPCAPLSTKMGGTVLKSRTHVPDGMVCKRRRVRGIVISEGAFASSRLSSEFYDRVSLLCFERGHQSVVVREVS